MGKSFAKDETPIRRKLTFSNPELVSMLCGEHNAHLQLLEEKIGLSIHMRGNDLTLEGGDWEVELAEKVLNQLYGLIKNKYPVYSNDVGYAIRILSKDPSCDLGKIFNAFVEFI